MIKITFHHPQNIMQHGLEQECMFVEAFSASILGNELVADFGDNSEVVQLDNIKSITHLDK
jgi:hypothetical protein